MCSTRMVRKTTKLTTMARKARTKSIVIVTNHLGAPYCLGLTFRQIFHPAAGPVRCVGSPFLVTVITNPVLESSWE